VPCQYQITPDGGLALCILAPEQLCPILAGMGGVPGDEKIA